LESAARNRVLKCLAHDALKPLLDGAEVMTLQRGRRLYRQDAPVQTVYFPLTGVVSVLVGTGEDAEVEMATVGNEGVVGIAALLGSPRALGKMLIQIPVEAIAAPAATVRHAIKKDDRCSILFDLYLYAFLRQVMQAGACNRLHSPEERCARWLLMTQDRAGKDEFSLTQDFLAEMMGTRRAAVNVALAQFRRAGAIDYVYRRIAIVDRKLLESFSCPCYGIIRKAHDAVKL